MKKIFLYTEETGRTHNSKLSTIQRDTCYSRSLLFGIEFNQAQRSTQRLSRIRLNRNCRKHSPIAALVCLYLDPLGR